MNKASVFVSSAIPWGSPMHMALKGLAILVLGLLAGSTVAVWRGYNSTVFSLSAFLEIHKGAVNGLNTLLPLMGLCASLLTIVLIGRQCAAGKVPWLYMMALASMIAAGLITRFGNQPINAIVMGWTDQSVPGNWSELRDKWWTMHVIRTQITIAAFALLVAGAITEQPDNH